MRLEASRPADPGTVDAENPWPGLASFREVDRDLFYGREAETQEILRLVLRERLTVLFGLSGLGKTSLLRAGLFPLLREENVLPVYIRLDFSSEGIRRTLSGQVRQAIPSEAADAGVEAPAFPESETLWETLHRQGAEFWSPRNRIVTPLLVFDQFEEIFTLGRGNAARAQEAAAFLTELADLCEGSVPADLRARLEADPSATRGFSFTRHPYKILLSLREDFLPELEGLRGRIRSIVHNRFRLRRMNGDNALRVVTQAGGHLVEPDVPERIVRFVAGRESEEEIPRAELEVEPALLSVVCRELNNKRRAHGLPRITADLVQGNRDEILSGLYERSVGDLGPEVRSFIEERLLTKSGFRDSVALENAVESPGVTREALDTLTDRRLLRIEDRGGIQRIELTHDVLTGVIRKSRDHRREREEEEREEAARRVAELKLRRSRLIIGLLGLVLLGVIALAVWGFNAQRKAGKALASSDVERAASLQDSNPAQALAYLARALREEPESIPAQSRLIDLLLYRHWPHPLTELRPEDAEWVELSDDGHLFVAVSEGGGKIRIWDTQTLRQVGEVRQSLPIRGIDISQDGRLLLIVSPDTAGLWDTRTGKTLWQLDPKDQEPLRNEVGERGPRLSPDGRWLAWLAVHRDRQPATALALRDNETRRQSEIPLSGAVVQLGFSPDSRRIFAEGSAEVAVWEVESGRSLPPFKTDSPIQDVAFGPDSRHLLVFGEEATILWDPERRIERQIGDGASSSGWLGRGGERAAIYRADSEELRVWNTETESPEPLAALPRREVYDAEFSPDGRRLLTTSEEGVELWDAATGRPVSLAFCECLHARFLAGTRQIVTADDTGILRVWSQEPRQTGTELYHSESGSLDRSFSQDGSRLALGAGDGTVHLWDMDAVRRLEPIPEVESFAGLSPDGLFLYEERGDDLQIRDLQTGRLAWPPLRLPAPRRSTQIDLANGIVGVQGREAGAPIQIWSRSTGHWLRAAPPPRGQQITYFDFTPGGDLVTSAGAGVSTWDSRTGRPLGAPLTHESAVTAFDISPDGERIATGTYYGLVRIWDLRSRQLLAGPLRHRDQINSVWFHPKGRLLLTRARNLVRLWDAGTGQPRSLSIRAEGEVESTQLSLDGARILVLSKDLHPPDSAPSLQHVALLDARSGQPLVRTSFAMASLNGAQLSSTGQTFWVASPGQIHVFAVPRFPRQDRELLARWAEAVGGWAVGGDGQLVELSDQLARLYALRRETADAPPGQLRADSLIRWFLSNPKTRPVSPLFERTLVLR